MKKDSLNYFQKDFQTIGKTNTYDEFGNMIVIKKSRTVSISYKLNKRGKKMIDVDIDIKVLDTLLNINTKVGRKIYKLIRMNTNREGMLTKPSTTKPLSINELSKEVGADRSVVSKCINALIKLDVLKKDKRVIYINPMVYLPLVNDFALRCLVDRYNDGFIKPLSVYENKLTLLKDLATQSAKKELDFENESLVNTKYVKTKQENK